MHRKLFLNITAYHSYLETSESNKHIYINRAIPYDHQSTLNGNKDREKIDLSPSSKCPVYCLSSPNLYVWILALQDVDIAARNSGLSLRLAQETSVVACQA